MENGKFDNAVFHILANRQTNECGHCAMIRNFSGNGLKLFPKRFQNGIQSEFDITRQICPTIAYNCSRYANEKLCKLTELMARK